MGTVDISLKRIFEELLNGNAGMAIIELDTYLQAWPDAQSKEKLMDIKADYQLMSSYWEQNLPDPQREEQYLRLMQRIYVLSANISIHRHMMGSSFLQSLYKSVRTKDRSWSISQIRAEMESFVSDVAMLELENDDVREEKSAAIYKSHQQQMNALFNYLLTSHIWTDSVGQAITGLVLSPTVDSCDQQLIVSAVTLSLMNRFDIAKLRMLVSVYRQSADEAVRQRALVGWVMGLDQSFLHIFPEAKTLVDELLQQESVCQELTELQMQLVYTLGAESDRDTIEKEIIPDMLKNNNFKFTSKGLEEIEDDPLEDALHPDAAEERMEKVEASVRRMEDMHARGADIYFGGFSQMKRFPFFYDMSNWFVPFYIEHPDISQHLKNMEGRQFIEELVNNGPAFCESDKYSFVIAYQQIAQKLPESMRQAIRNGEARLHEFARQEGNSTTFIRRSYLMDLFRFFRLFPNRSSLLNPFDTAKSELGFCLFFASGLFCETPLDKHKPAVVSMLRKRHLNASAQEVLDTFPDEMHDVQYYIWQEDYENALSLAPDNERALAGHARQMFDSERYAEALDSYEHLLLLHPEKRKYMLSKAVCLIHLEEYDDAQQLLFQLNYEQPDNVAVSRALAWVLSCNGKLEQAENIYRQLTAADDATAEDFLNQGHCLWLNKKIAEAAASMRRYVEMSGGRNNSSTLFDEEFLVKRGITITEIRMMEALVSGL